MKIMIDIDNDLYTRLFDNDEDNVADMQEVCTAVRKGKVIPKGHGRIIDESKITKYEQVGLAMKDDNVRRIIATDAPTIIEKDRAESKNV